MSNESSNLFLMLRFIHSFFFLHFRSFQGYFIIKLSLSCCFSQFHYSCIQSVQLRKFVDSFFSLLLHRSGSKTVVLVGAVMRLRTNQLHRLPRVKLSLNSSLKSNLNHLTLCHHVATHTAFRSSRFLQNLCLTHHRTNPTLSLKQSSQSLHQRLHSFHCHPVNCPTESDIVSRSTRRPLDY